MNVNAGSQMNKIMNQQQNLQAPMPQNPSIQTSMPQVSQNNSVVTSQAQVIFLFLNLMFWVLIKKFKIHAKYLLYLKDLSAPIMM